MFTVCGMASPPPRPRRYLLAAVAALPLALAAASTAAQAPPPDAKQPRPAKPQPSLAGLPLYTADGKAIGKVLAFGLDEDDKPMLVAEIERMLGFGPTAIAVPVDMFVRKADRIELTLTEAEVAAKLKK